MTAEKNKTFLPGFERFLAGDGRPPEVSEAIDVLEDLAGFFLDARVEANRISRARSNDYETIYRILAEQIPAVVFLAFLDEGFGQAYVSPHIETVLGFTQQEWLNDPVRWYKQLHPDDKERWSREAAEMFLSGAPLKSTYRVIARDGHTVWFQCDARMIRHDDGSPWLVHGVAFDITELKESQHALARDVAERQRLERQLLQAQKMESIGTLAGGIAHDFNNILNIIQGYSALIMETSGDRRKLRENVQVIRETVERGAVLVQQLLTVARKTEVKFEPVDIDELLRKVAKLTGETFPKTITISLELHSNLPRTQADPNRLVQALLNLCVNARDAMNESGTLTLRNGIVSGSDLRHRFPDADEQRYVSVAVADTGPGMEKNIRDHIFDPFFTTKEPGKGTGLGLPMAYSIVRDHNGFIDVQSEPGRGTTFCIYIPLIIPDAGKSVVQELAINEMQRSQESGQTVLFVEDEPHQVNLIRDFLERSGYRVLIARDGVEAVKIHHHHSDQIAAVILDLSLPKLNGWDAFLSIKQKQPTVRTILATGYITPDQRSMMLSEGVIDILPKPYVPNDLLKRLREVIT